MLNSNLMRVDPVHASVGNFFQPRSMYTIPKYQRSYAWEINQIDDFLSDLENAFNRRLAGTPSNHFFGGIVSVKSTVPHVVNQSVYELVDGQQRMATFILFISTVIAVYKDLQAEAQTASDNGSEAIVRRRIAELSERYIEFQQEVNRILKDVEVLQLSKADHGFFRDLIRQVAPLPIVTRDSHRNLLNAYNTILLKVKTLTGTSNINDKLDNLEIFKDLMDGDFSLIHIVTHNKQEAYTLFRVLNDRGKNLTDGDMLRARVLELLEGHSSQQSSVETIWDRILSDPPNVTEEYLRWIYASYNGAKPGSNTLFDDFLSKFFPQHANSSITTADATAILSTTRQLEIDIDLCKSIDSGIWPYTLVRPLTQWDASRLNLLVKELRISITNPLLLAASLLSQDKFSKIVHMLEIFMFRFKIIGNQHHAAVNTIVLAQSIMIRSNPSGYNVDSLKNALHALQITKIPDIQFSNLLDNLNYKDGGGNQVIKYFLMTIEHYTRWYDLGATGEPKVMDKTIVFDFNSTTIEHIYPRNPLPANFDSLLDPLKNSLGNLTFMGPADNLAGANLPFLTKKPIFEQSNVHLNKAIGSNLKWEVAEVDLWLSKLKAVAVKVFNV